MSGCFASADDTSSSALYRLPSKETGFSRSSIPHLHCRSTTGKLTCFDQDRRRLNSIQGDRKQKWLIGLRSRQSLRQALRSFRASIGTALSHSHQSSSRILLLLSVSGRKHRWMRSDVYSSLRSRHQSGRPHTKAQGRDERKRMGRPRKITPEPAVTSVFA